MIKRNIKEAHLKNKPAIITIKSTSKSIFEKKLTKLKDRRSDALKFLNRWDDFRERKDEVVDTYVMVKKKSEQTKRMAILAIVVNGINLLWNTFFEKRRKTRMRMRMMLMLKNSMRNW